MKSFIARWEITFYVTALIVYAVALGLVVVVFPGVSNLWVSIFVLVSGLFSLLAALASALRDRQ